MKFVKTIGRRADSCISSTIKGFPHARMYTLCSSRGSGVLSFSGVIPMNLLVIPITGCVAYRENARTAVAEPGDALLIEAGLGSLELRAMTKAPIVLAEIIAFDARSVARILRSSVMEEIACSMAVEFQKPATRLKDFTVQVDSCMNAALGGMGAALPPKAEMYMRSLYNGTRAMPIALMKTAFYRRRWALFQLLERHVLFLDAEKRIENSYPGGKDVFHSDCRTYLGSKPASLINARRTQLAEIWLRNGNSVDSVAQAFGYSSLWEFQCFYSASAKRKWSHVKSLGPLSSLAPAGLAEVLRPVWWHPKLPLAPSMQPFVRGDNAQGSLDLLRKLEPDFFEMKSTAADFVVPIYQASAASGEQLRFEAA